jgi:hypothetical protein
MYALSSRIFIAANFFSTALTLFEFQRETDEGEDAEERRVEKLLVNRFSIKVNGTFHCA